MVWGLGFRVGQSPTQYRVARETIVATLGSYLLHMCGLLLIGVMFRHLRVWGLGFRAC